MSIRIEPDLVDFAGRTPARMNFEHSSSILRISSVNVFTIGRGPRGSDAFNQSTNWMKRSSSRRGTFGHDATMNEFSNVTATDDHEFF